MSQPFYLGQQNVSYGNTELIGEVPKTEALTVLNGEGIGIIGVGTGQEGDQGNLAGVIGEVGGLSSQTFTAGVLGFNNIPAVGPESYGQFTSAGVIGIGISTNGMNAISRDSDALYALSVDHGNSIVAQAFNGNALFAFNSPTGNFAGSPAIWAESNGDYAAGFLKDVVVFGNLHVVNGSANAAFEHPDGSYSTLYNVNAPEPWFEDFGRTSLEAGVATVALEERFEAMASNDYHVFVTPEGDCKGLYVASRSSANFVVRESQNGTSDVTFSYRLVVRRTDIDNERFKSVKLPDRPQRLDIEETARQAERLMHQAVQTRSRRRPPTS